MTPEESKFESREGFKAQIIRSLRHISRVQMTIFVNSLLHPREIQANQNKNVFRLPWKSSRSLETFFSHTHGGWRNIMPWLLAFSFSPFEKLLHFSSTPLLDDEQRREKKKMKNIKWCRAWRGTRLRSVTVFDKKIYICYYYCNYNSPRFFCFVDVVFLVSFIYAEQFQKWWFWVSWRCLPIVCCTVCAVCIRP